MKRKPVKFAAISGAYPKLLNDLKERIRAAQVRTALVSNAGLLMLYWEIGGLLVERQKTDGWGAGVLRRLADDLRNDLSEIKGFSERNLKLMTQFFREYPGFPSIGQPAVAQLEEGTPGGPMAGAAGAEFTVARLTPIGQLPVAQLPWAHNIILIQKVKDLRTRLWYAQRALENGWSRNILSLQIKNRSHQRQGRATHNFQQTLPPAQSDLAAQILKDPYIFDFLTLETPFHERELETSLLRHIQHFLLELGSGFAFVGRQFHLEIGDDDFYLDLLFYHLRLRCFVVIDLKVGPFKAEYAGKMNFYLNAVDDRLKHPQDQRSIGLILCEDKNKIVAEYALRGMDKAIGVSAYQLTRALPKKLQSSLPSIAQIEKELSQNIAPKAARAKARRVTRGESARRRRKEAR